MKAFVCTWFVFIVMLVACFAQSSRFQGKIVDNTGAPLVGAHVQLLELKVGDFTAEDGSFLLEKVPFGNYTMQVSYIGYRTFQKELRFAAQVVSENVTLEMLEGRLHEVVVSASRRTLEVKRLPDVQGTYIMAGKKNEVIDIASLNTNLSEKIGRQLFAKVPGVLVYDMDGAGNQINVSTRGLDPHRSWEYNVRQNGIMLNSDIYGYPASHYSPPLEAIQRVEIVRGTAALQYGAQFGGMINYVTKQPDTTQRIGFESINSVGSFGLFSSYNAISGKLGKWQYFGYVQKRISDGYRHVARSDSEAQYAMLSYQPNERLSIQAELGRSTYQFRIPGPLTDSMFYENPRQATRARNFYSPDIIVPSLTVDWKIGRNTHLNFVTSGVFGTRNSVMLIAFANVPDRIDPATNQYRPRQVDIDRFNSRAAELRLLQNYQVGNLNSTLTTGIRYTNNLLNRKQQGPGTTGFDYDLTTTGPWRRDLDYKTQNIALFLENIVYITPKWSITPGLRMESGDTRMSGFLDYKEPEDIPLSIQHEFPLFGVSTQYKINSSTRVYAGWSQAYRPVIMADVVPPTRLDVTDPNLKDAFGHNLEAGISGNFFNNAINLDLGVFEVLYNNRIGSLVLQNDRNESYIFKTNLGDSRTRGVEAYIEASPMRLAGLYKDWDFSLFSATSFFDGAYLRGNAVVNGENRDISDNVLEGTPRWMSRNGLQFNSYRFSATLQYSYVTESFSDALNTERPTANGGAGIVPAYALWDFNASVYLGARYTLRLSLNNFTNEQYFTKRPVIYPGAGVWPSDGRSVVVTFGVKL